ncbi:MAG: cysteine desulfurase family protein [Micavibrio sp.]
MTMRTPVYLDCHATTPCDPAVVESMIPYFGLEKFGNSNARTHANGRRAAQALAQAKAEIAALVNANPENIILTSGATEANMMALAAPKSSRTEILVSALEHPSVFDAARQSGLSVKIIPATADGFITPESLRALISDKTQIVSVMLANHEIGTIQSIAALAEIARDAGALFHCDATQAAGKIPVDVSALGVDFLSFSAHKLYGPQGIGALYARSGTVQRPGTVPLALAVGMAAACRIAGEKMQDEAARLQDLTDILLQKLQDNLLQIQVNGALSPRLPGSLNFRLPGINAENLLLDLAEDLCLSTGAACASKTRQPSPVLKAIRLSDIEISNSIRLSMGRMTMREDILFAVEKITAHCRQEIVRLRQAS